MSRAPKPLQGHAPSRQGRSVGHRQVAGFERTPDLPASQPTAIGKEQDPLQSIVERYGTKIDVLDAAPGIDQIAHVGVNGLGWLAERPLTLAIERAG